MTNKEAIEQIESLADHCNDMRKAGGDEIWTLDAVALNKAAEAIRENEKLKVALFGVVRNSKVMPVGLAKGKSMKEINKMAVATIHELLNGDIIDWARMAKSYEEGGGKF